jgi:mono/diheme cytochrome c family protein
MKPPSNLVLAAAVTLTLLASACSSATSVGGTGSTCASDSSLTYANFGQAFIQTNCGGCHIGRDRPDLSTQAAVQANKTAIDQVAAAGPNGENTTMPQNGTVSTADRTKLGEWLACGAP